MKTAAAYGMSVELVLPYERAVEVVTLALKEEGFGVLTTIDVRATMKEKLGVDVPPQVILGACNPPLAHAALQSDPNLGLLLPCNVTVRATATGSLVSIIDPNVMSRLSEAEGLADVAREARDRLERVLEKVKGEGR